LAEAPAGALVHADKGYDTDHLRRLIEAGGGAPNIPAKAHRIWENCFSPYLYRRRNAIERMFGRLKDFRHIAIRNDRLAAINLAALCLAATVSYKSRVRSLMRDQSPLFGNGTSPISSTSACTSFDGTVASSIQ
jgi:transposase